MTEINYDKFINNGWIESTNPIVQSDKFFYKLFEGHSECYCNEGKKKQVELYVWDHRKYGAGVSYEVRCTGQLPDETWINLEAYSLNENEPDEKAEELLEMWDWAVKNNLTKLEKEVI